MNGSMLLIITKIRTETEYTTSVLTTDWKDLLTALSFWITAITSWIFLFVCKVTHMLQECFACQVTSLMSDSLWPYDCTLPGSSAHGDSPGKNPGMDGFAFLQRIFPTQDWTWASCATGRFFTTRATAPWMILIGVNIGFQWNIRFTKNLIGRGDAEFLAL